MDLASVFILFLWFFGSAYNGADGVALEIDLRLTNEQKQIMDKFKKIMAPKLPHGYMHEEIYLVRWLRAKNFDLKKSEEFLLANLKWRKQTRMDTIQLEDWSDIKVDFPYYIDGDDKRGQPVITAISREWDLRSAVVTGRVNRALRYLDKAMDQASTIVRNRQLAGQNVTQFVLILHMGNFNLFQHGCPRCITGILEFIDSYENHFPGLADKILLVQTPPVFEAIAQLVKEAASPQTREALKIYGLESKVWKTALREIIEKDQLTEEFGGIRMEIGPS